MKPSYRQSPKADILIVDDTLENLHLLSSVLTERGYNVRGASNGATALKAIRLEPPDLILLDVRMPEIDGYEVCQQVKTDNRTKAIPVIFLSALDETVNTLKGFEVGGVDYIGKPFQTEEVVARVATHLRLVDMQKHVEAQNTQLQRTNDRLAREIAEHEQTEAALRTSEAELQALFAAITDVILVLDGDGRYLKIAPTLPELLYKPMPEVLGKTLHEVFPRADADQFLAVIRQSLDRQQMVTIEYTLPIRGHTVWFDGRMSPMSANTVLFVARDITARKLMEEDLRKAKDDALEAQHAAEAAQRASDTASQAKSVFLANMSHELRTPLTSILGFAGVLEHDDALTDAQCEHAAIIRRNGDRLLTVINDIFDFTRIETDRLELRPAEFALPAMLLQLADMIRLHAEHKGLSFGSEIPVDLPQIVFADQKRLRQILMNLLRNAVNFTEYGSLTLRVARLTIDGLKSAPEFNRQSTLCQFSIIDTGIGIAPDQLEAIFQPFQQADPYKLQEGRTGLGLAISQRLLKMMNSQLQVTSTEGQGTTFRFDLDLPVVETPAFQGMPEAPSPQRKTSVVDEPTPPLSGLLPAEWIATLRQAVEEADVEVLFDVIAHIRERDPGVADSLTQLAHDFEYDEILRLIHNGI